VHGEATIDVTLQILILRIAAFAVFIIVPIAPVSNR
jgi:hypothetical protein